MAHPTLTEALRPFFPNLKEESLHALAAFCRVKEVSKHTEIMSEGKQHPYTYLILSGAAKSYYLKDGKEICIWFAFEEEIIGSMVTFQGLPSSETVVQLEDCQLIQIHLTQLRELAKQDLSISNMLNDLLMEHVMFMEEKLRQIQFMTAQERYAALLESEPSLLQRVSLTDIASYLGVSRETLSRIRAMK